MHAERTVAAALELARLGANATDISRQLHVPRRTVCDWLAGLVPRRNAAPTVCRVCGASDGPPQLPPAYTYLLGLYLGDGCLSLHHKGIYRLRIVLDVKYPGIIQSARVAMSQIRGREAHVQVRRDGCAEVSTWWKHWPCFFPQHGAGSKHRRVIELRDWQQQLVDRSPDMLLRGLIQSDGCRFQNTGRRWSWPRYAFTNHSSDIRSIFCRTCEQIGLHWTASGKYTIYVSRKADVARLDSFIGPKA